MDTEQVTFGEIKLSQVQVYFEGAHIGRLERAGGYDENLDFWGLSDKLVERYGRGHDVQTKGLDTVKRWAWALEMDHQRQGQKEKDMQARPQKKTWSFLWDDRAGETGPLSRKRVAELLRGGPVPRRPDHTPPARVCNRLCLAGGAPGLADRKRAAPKTARVALYRTPPEWRPCVCGLPGPLQSRRGPTSRRLPR